MSKTCLVQRTSSRVKRGDRMCDLRLSHVSLVTPDRLFHNLMVVVPFARVILGLVV